MNRLIVASNRVGDFKSGFQAGGLAVALCSMLRSRGGVWFGSTETSSSVATPGRSRPEARLERAEGTTNVELCGVMVDEQLYRDYYMGFANSVLWPVFHNRLDLAKFDNDFYAAYREVNSCFADAIADHAKPGDMIWVHDYHLIPLGEELRRRGINNPIGFFLHIPFPNGQVLASISQHGDLGICLSAYDLVGFQTSKDTAAFLDYVQHYLDGRILSDAKMRVRARTIRCGSFPVGIDTVDFANRAAKAEDDPGERETLTSRLELDHIIGVDRLDYTKGLLQRFEAYARFLERNPHRHRKVDYLQIAPPTRHGLNVYNDIQDEVARLAGATNGSFGELDWMPVRFINKALPRERLAGLFRWSKVGLVTPIQDGMNLVAKEYVAAQNPKTPGVLVLSEFAGAAETLRGAWIVNPHDVDGFASAIESALCLPLDERIDRHRTMYSEILKHDIHDWARSFIREMESSAKERQEEADAIRRFFPQSPGYKPSPLT